MSQRLVTYLSHLGFCLVTAINGASVSAAATDSMTMFRYALPLHPRITRPVDWPERLTFTPQNEGLDQIKEIFYGRWRYVFLCSGRPIEAAKFAPTGVLSGAGSNRMTDLTYHRDMSGRRVLTDSLAAYFDDVSEAELLHAMQEDDDGTFTWRLSQNRDGSIQRHASRFISARLRLLIVDQTGERVFKVIDKPNVNRNNLCHQGEGFEKYLVRFTPLTS